ncbi:MAG: hypothetical protein ACRCYS_14960, partial [Beijerinckiaceae bacterium]
NSSKTVFSNRQIKRNMQETITMLENRADKTRRERRFNPSAVENNGLKLFVADDKLNKRDFTHRFVSDTPGRIKSMEDKDWDIVKDDVKPDASGLGSPTSVVVGVDGGQPVHGILMRKHKDWYESDQKAKQDKLLEFDKAIMRGTAHAKSEGDLRGAVAYTPNGGNQIT